MNPVWASLSMIGRVLAEALTSPFSIILFTVLVAIIAWQYRRSNRFSGDLRGGGWRLSLQAALLSAGFGVVGGLVGSILLFGAGVDLNRIAITPLWVAALLLMLISPRLLCFSYAGGLLGLSKLLFGYPDVSIPDLMALIAILHLVESLLILLDGRFYPVPLYVKRGNRLCGGFNLQKFWPLLLVVMVQDLSVVSSQQADWMAVLGSSVFGTGAYMVLAVLGYGEVSTAFPPGQKSLRSAGRLFCFSVILLFLTFLSLKWPVFLYISVLFSPLGHELVIWLGLREENRKPPIYVEPGQGVMVLDTRPASTACRSGLKSGDIIVKGGGRSILHSADLETFLFLASGQAQLEGLRSGQPSTWIIDPSSEPMRGIIPVPGRYHSSYFTIPTDSLFGLASRMFRMLKGRFHERL
ncbi:MAG: hypothetical protein ABRQ26_14610 [Syntrophomonadaceae bacterium]